MMPNVKNNSSFFSQAPRNRSSSNNALAPQQQCSQSQLFPSGNQRFSSSLVLQGTPHPNGSFFNGTLQRNNISVSEVINNHYTAAQEKQQETSEFVKEMTNLLQEATVGVSQLVFQKTRTHDQETPMLIKQEIEKAKEVQEYIKYSLQTYNLIQECNKNNGEIGDFSKMQLLIEQIFTIQKKMIESVREELIFQQNQENHELDIKIKESNQMLKEQGEAFEQFMQECKFNSDERRLDIEAKLNTLKEKNKTMIEKKKLKNESDKTKLETKVEENKTEVSLAIAKVSKENETQMAQIESETKKHEAEMKLKTAETESGAKKIVAIAEVAKAVATAGVGTATNTLANGFMSVISSSPKSKTSGDENQFKPPVENTSSNQKSSSAGETKHSLEEDTSSTTSNKRPKNSSDTVDLPKSNEEKESPRLGGTTPSSYSQASDNNGSDSPKLASSNPTHID